jgi:hypothetical protein
MVNGRIVQYRTKQRKPARRGHPALEAGSLLWLIEYPTNPPRYFTYGYVLKISAAKVKDRLTGDSTEIEFNSTTDPERVMQTWSEVE